MYACLAAVTYKPFFKWMKNNMFYDQENIPAASPQQETSNTLKKFNCKMRNSVPEDELHELLNVN